ncbi:MAG: DnaJ domain-containing protein [Pirellulales bacterium]
MSWIRSSFKTFLAGVKSLFAENSSNDTLIMLTALVMATFFRDTDGPSDRSRSFIISILREIGLSEIDAANIADSQIERTRDNEITINVFTSLRDLDKSIPRILTKLLWRCSCQDHDITDKELTWISEFSDITGIEVPDRIAILLPYFRKAEELFDTPVNDSCFTTLEMPPTTSAEEVTKQFRRLSLKYHPDRHSLANADLQSLAKQKYAQIVDAYERLMTQLSVSRDWKGLNISKQEAVTATARMKVWCYICGRACRLPAEEHFGRARCPECNSLLLFRGKLSDMMHELYAVDAAEKVANRASKRSGSDVGEQATSKNASNNQAANEQAASEQAAKEQAAKEQAAKEQAAKEQAAKEQAAKEQAAKEQAAREQAAKEQAAKEQAAKEQAARAQAAREQAAREQAAREQAAREQAARAQAAKEQAAKEQAAREQAITSVKGEALSTVFSILVNAGFNGDDVRDLLMQLWHGPVVAKIAANSLVPMDVRGVIRQELMRGVPATTAIRQLVEAGYAWDAAAIAVCDVADKL